MSNVRLDIGGRDFSVSCAPGEEEHIAMLGRQIDDKLRTMGAATGNSESRMLLLAALLLADEVHELKSGKGTAPAAPDRSALLREMAKSLDGTAARIEKLATRLEQSAANP